MNLKEIRYVLSLSVPDDVMEKMIIRVLSEDKKVIPLIMEILDYERSTKQELLGEMNMQLSRAHLGLEKPKINKDHFMDKEILNFYLKNKKHVGHCFKDLRDVELSEEEENKNKMPFQ